MFCNLALTNQIWKESTIPAACPILLCYYKYTRVISKTTADVAYTQVGHRRLAK